MLGEAPVAICESKISGQQTRTHLKPGADLGAKGLGNLVVRNHLVGETTMSMNR